LCRLAGNGRREHVYSGVQESSCRNPKAERLTYSLMSRGVPMIIMTTCGGILGYRLKIIAPANRELGRVTLPYAPNSPAQVGALIGQYYGP
jgi:hypothetical protein